MLSISFRTPDNPDASRPSLPFYLCRVSAGMPSPAEPYEDEKLDLNEHLNIKQARTFIFRVNNNDMQHFGIYDGALLVVDRSLTPKHGKTVIAEAEGEYGVYQFIRKTNQCYLKMGKAFLLTDQKEVIIKGVVKAIIQPL